MPWRESAQELDRALDERPVVVPSPHGGLVGIFTPPSPAAAPAGLCAILLTRPRSHRNRMWVEGARRFATRGFACFRFDYHGAGDSEGPSAFLDPNQPYREDVVAVIRYLREHLGQSRFVLSGSCFDARTALSAFMDEGDAVEGLLFIAAPVMELSTMVKVDADHRTWKHVTLALLKPENWRAMLKAERWRYVGTILSRMARRRVQGAEQDHPLSPSFVEHFDALVRSHAQALFIYGQDDPEYQSFRIAERTVFRPLPPEVRRRFEVEIYPGVVHGGFVTMERQREIFERAAAWIESLHPRRAASPSRDVEAAVHSAAAPTLGPALSGAGQGRNGRAAR
jgi:pimeloyl-ACP methyl ester carboxylesterase